MDKTVNFLEYLPSNSLKLTLNQDPLFQKQRADYWSIKGTVMKDYDLFICTGGQARFSQGDESTILQEGSVFLVIPGTPLFAEHVGDEYFTAAAQHFDFNVFGEIDLFSLIKYRTYLKFSDWEYIKVLLERYRILTAEHKKNLEQHSIFYTILCEYVYDSYTSEKMLIHEKYLFIFQILSYIQTHLTEIDVMEKSLKLSPYSHDYTSRVFKKRIGLPLKQYILKNRLTLSRNLLLQEFSVKEVAYQCGFSDELYFSRLFKRYMLLSPTEFRKQKIMGV